MSEITVTELIQHRFTVKEDDGTEYTDAIYYPVGSPPVDLEAQRQARFNNWKAAVVNPPAPRELTEEEIAAQIEFMVAEKERIEQQLAVADPVKVATARTRLGLPEEEARVR